MGEAKSSLPFVDSTTIYKGQRTFTEDRGTIYKGQRTFTEDKGTIYIVQRATHFYWSSTQQAITTRAATAVMQRELQIWFYKL